MQGLRTSCETGAPFTKVLLNRRKSGDLFLNLLDLRGLTVARKPSGQDFWLLVGIQADVTGIAEEDVPEDHLAYLHKVATEIRAKLKDQLCEMAVAGSLTHNSGPNASKDAAGLWHPVIKARWKPGDQLAESSYGTLARMSRNSLPLVVSPRGPSSSSPSPPSRGSRDSSPAAAQRRRGPNGSRRPSVGELPNGLEGAAPNGLEGGDDPDNKLPRVPPFRGVFLVPLAVGAAAVVLMLVLRQRWR
jgi:hypothetical protein